MLDAKFVSRNLRAALRDRKAFFSDKAAYADEW